MTYLLAEQPAQTTASAPACRKTPRGGALAEIVSGGAPGVTTPVHPVCRQPRHRRQPAVVSRPSAWCALQVPAGREDSVRRRVAALLAGQARNQPCAHPVDAFIVRREMFFRDAGVWRTRTEPLFPGYVFLATTAPCQLDEQLDLLAGGAVLLRQDARVCVMSPQEIAFIERLADSRTHLVAVSRGVICNGVTHVTEGPLAGNEHLIKKIDRHKRIAYLGDEALAGSVLAGEGCGLARVALEIYSKT